MQTTSSSILLNCSVLTPALTGFDSRVEVAVGHESVARFQVFLLVYGTLALYCTIKHSDLLQDICNGNLFKHVRVALNAEVLPSNRS